MAPLRHAVGFVDDELAEQLPRIESVQGVEQFLAGAQFLRRDVQQLDVYTNQQAETNLIYTLEYANRMMTAINKHRFPYSKFLIPSHFTRTALGHSLKGTLNELEPYLEGRPMATLFMYETSYEDGALPGFLMDSLQ